MCLLEWFRKEQQWGHLFRLLGQLGQDSRWKKAMFDDPEMAKTLAEEALANEGSKWSPADVDFTLLHEMLAQVIELQKKHLTMISTTPHRLIEPFPRPVTALSAEIERLRQERSDAELAKVYDFVERGQQRWLQLNGGGDDVA